MKITIPPANFGSSINLSCGNVFLGNLPALLSAGGKKTSSDRRNTCPHRIDSRDRGNETFEEKD